MIVCVNSTRSLEATPSFPGSDMFPCFHNSRSQGTTLNSASHPFCFSAIRSTLKLHFQQKPPISLRVSAFRSNPQGKIGFRQRCACKGGCKDNRCNCVKRGASCHSGCRCYNGKPCENDRQGCPYQCKFDDCDFDGTYSVVQDHEKTCKRRPKRGRVGGKGKQILL